jgi:nucleolar protein TMA23
MWWMNAFDKSLKGLNTSKEGTVVQTIVNGGLDMVAKGGSKFIGNGEGLYASFVRGECLSDTMTPKEMDQQSLAKKRKMDEAAKETNDERKARKAAKRALRRQKAAVAQASPVKDSEETETQKVETKEERKERRRQKKLLRQADQNTVETSESAKKRRRKA